MRPTAILCRGWSGWSSDWTCHAARCDGTTSTAASLVHELRARATAKALQLNRSCLNVLLCCCSPAAACASEKAHSIPLPVWAHDYRSLPVPVWIHVKRFTYIYSQYLLRCTLLADLYRSLYRTGVCTCMYMYRSVGNEVVMHLMSVASSFGHVAWRR